MSEVIVVSNEKPQTAAAPAGTEDEADQSPAAGDTAAESHAASGAADEPAEKEENEETQGDESKDKKPSKGGFQKRIDKLTRQKAELEREREFWRAEALKGKPAPQKEEPAAKSEPAAETGKPKAEDYASHEEYVEALADWKVEQKLSKRDADAAKKQEKSELEQKVSTFVERKAAFQKEHPDYDDVMEACEAPMSKFVQNYLLKKENGPAIAYHLAKHPELLESISGMSDADAAEELGVLRASLSSQAKDQPKPRTSKAPEPISPVGGATKSTATKSPFDEGLSYAEFEKAERARLRAKQGA